jgi:hypothetical protein
VRDPECPHTHTPLLSLCDWLQVLLRSLSILKGNWRRICSNESKWPSCSWTTGSVYTDSAVHSLYIIARCHFHRNKTLRTSMRKKSLPLTKISRYNINIVYTTQHLPIYRVCPCVCCQELCGLTKQRMMSEVEERMRRLQEEAIVSKLSGGNHN